MFKKSLLALALAGAAVTANAATISTANVNVALEGNKLVGSSALQHTDFAANAITIDVGAEYIVNDVVAITVTGAAFDTSVTPTLTPSAGGASFTFVDYQGTSTARFRVSTANHLPANDLAFASFTLNTSAAADKGVVQFSSKAISQNATIGDYDAAKATTVATFRSQLATSITVLNGEVSTAKGRKEFTGATPLADALTVTYTNNADLDGLTLTKVTNVIKGNFSYVIDYDADKDGKLSSAELATAFTVADGDDTTVLTINDGLSELTAVQTLTGALDNPTITFNVKGETASGSAIAAPQSFSIETTGADASARSVAIASKSAGKFTLDGSNDEISYMPFGSQYAQSVNVTNTGTVEGAITVTLTADGKDYVKTLTATAAAKSVTNITSEVVAFAKESGITGNARINVVVNAPSGNIAVDAIYYHKTDGDRVKTK